MPKVKRGQAEGTKGPKNKRKRNEKTRDVESSSAQSLSEVEVPQMMAPVMLHGDAAPGSPSSMDAVPIPDIICTYGRRDRSQRDLEIAKRDKTSHIMATEKTDSEENLSERVLEAMCEIVGTSQIVAQRREIMDINEKLCSFTVKGGFTCSLILAGSTRDGFRFDQSDEDLMLCFDDTRVIWNRSQFSNSTEHKTLFDNSESQPGYGLLQILAKQKAESSDLIITIKDLAKALLTQSCFMDSGIERCAEIITGQSLVTVRGRKSTSIVTLYNKVVYINELVKEQKQSLKYPWFEYQLFIPSYVLLLMLEFLCQRYIDENKAQTALAKLFDVVHCNEGMHITEDLKDISWQILGICQELSGNLHGALCAYKKSLACEQTLNRIRSASEERIQDVENLLQRNNATIS